MRLRYLRKKKLNPYRKLCCNWCKHSGKFGFIIKNRYEDFEEGLLKDFFLSKVMLDESIAHTFYWIVKLEKDNEGNHKEIRYQFKDLYDNFMEQLERI